jgi:hypothetical protein
MEERSDKTLPKGKAWQYPGGKAWQYILERCGNTWRRGLALPRGKIWQYLEERRGNNWRKGVVISGGTLERRGNRYLEERCRNT